MKVLIVGDKPSAYNSDPNKAFVGAKCYPRLLMWLKILEIDDYELINSHEPIYIHYIAQFQGPVIALGLIAQRRLKKAGISHIDMMHPSGLNRQLNNAKLVEYSLIRVKTLLNKML